MTEYDRATPSMMRCIVGVDLLPHSRGALKFSRWLANHPDEAPERFEAVHVLQDRDIRPVLSHVSLSEVERMARESFEQTVTSSELRDMFTTTDLVFDSSAEQALIRRANEDADTMLVIGRRATREGREWIRLGRVARRLLRALPTPVAVVPPDFEPPDSDTGPVVLATSMDTDSAGAADLAARLANRWKRPLVAVHVLAEGMSPPGYLPDLARSTLAAANRRETSLQLALWLRRHELPDIEATVVSGEVVEQLTQLASTRNACALVVGSRRLSLRERLFRSSVGADLAGASAVPVVVTPPPGD